MIVHNKNFFDYLSFSLSFQVHLQTNKNSPTLTTWFFPPEFQNNPPPTIYLIKFTILQRRIEDNRESPLAPEVNAIHNIEINLTEF